jgi:hypothetical protein
MPGSSGSAGKALRKSQNMTIKRIEKTMPAMAAALGVLRPISVTVFFADIAEPRLSNALLTDDPSV